VHNKVIDPLSPKGISTAEARREPVGASPIRKDSSPVKPLSTILNVPKILASPHTAEQISALWTAYHVARPGCLSAVIPLSTYEEMITAAKDFPTFIIPLTRANSVEDEDASHATAQQKSHEFYFLEWGMHEIPPDHHAVLDFPLTVARDSKSSQPNPHTSTVLFTPLAEYKLRQSFATPWLVITHHTDLAQSHGVVLMRGEITPSTSNPSSFSVRASDAQVLALALQKFYLKTKVNARGAELLRQFHRAPSEFQWENVVEYLDHGALL